MRMEQLYNRRYRLGNQLGQGRFGKVYAAKDYGDTFDEQVENILADDWESRGKDVAIKILKPQQGPTS